MRVCGLIRILRQRLEPKAREHGLAFSVAPDPQAPYTAILNGGGGGMMILAYDGQGRIDDVPRGRVPVKSRFALFVSAPTQLSADKSGGGSQFRPDGARKPLYEICEDIENDIKDFELPENDGSFERTPYYDGTDPAVLPDGRIAFLHAVRKHHGDLLGKLPAGQISIYLHTAESFGDPVVNDSGRAWFDDLSFDLSPLVIGIDSVLAHELGHVLKTAAAPTSGRPFLEEGLATYLEYSYAPGSVAGSARWAVCKDDWSLESLWVGSYWLSHQEEHGTYYLVAGLFVELGANRLGVPGFLDRIFVPASSGTIGSADEVLTAAGWAPLHQIERELHAACGCP